jgi:small GTP-binding protein
MSLAVSGTYCPSYNDTAATAHIQIHKSGYCPLHPDVKIRFRESTFGSKTHKECPRCEELHQIEVQNKRLKIDEVDAILQKKENEIKERDSKIEEQESKINVLVQAKESKKAEVIEREAVRKVLLKDVKRPVKVTLLGGVCVGKTSILRRYTKGEYSECQGSTISASYSQKNVCVLDNNRLSLDIWDTAGQERYRNVAVMYYRNADACVLVYDITDEKSFATCKSWYHELRKIAENHIIVYLIGNKADLEKKRDVNKLEVDEYAQHYGMRHYLISAKLNEGVDDFFNQLMLDLYNQRLEENRKNDVQGVITLKREEKKESSDCCVVS